MKNRVDVRTLLSVYEKIKSQGQTIEFGSQLDDIKCTESPDGYSVSLADDKVTLDINFHNTYHFHTMNEDPESVINQTTTEFHNNNEVQIQEFIGKLEEIDKNY
ncbi:DUF3081 family protein [Photobacterium sp. DNB23_23_1]|uniref:DUF3081 domain-containing protein n=1 Tax=Photobacterium pectinilyticum TaxID=2906793 RepID=A0ABT1N7W0_9GAMM|nr:DUF3081 family protein [Photobacterium sp. ZSDE20]MCQ1060823.1 DUF3081 domain-containing protein [Photobacterium sp. ZSDE20]MDD1828554.1 DUF3081 domain-containing protein [Photobacterium sp. ZSDE20]